MQMMPGSDVLPRLGSFLKRLDVDIRDILPKRDLANQRTWRVTVGPANDGEISSATVQFGTYLTVTLLGKRCANVFGFGMPASGRIERVNIHLKHRLHGFEVSRMIETQE